MGGEEIAMVGWWSALRTTAHRGFSKPNHYLNAFIVLMALSTCCGESEVGASVIGGGSGEEVMPKTVSRTELASSKTRRTRSSMEQMVHAMERESSAPISTRGFGSLGEEEGIGPETGSESLSDMSSTNALSSGNAPGGITGNLSPQGTATVVAEEAKETTT